QMASEHVLHMQKALDQMNLQIHRVLNDITGVSGLKILDAILAGERGPVTLARLCHGGVKSGEDVIAKSLEGDYRPEHLFALRQSLAAFRYYQQLVVEVDQEIQRQLGTLKTATTAEPTVPKRSSARSAQMCPGFAMLPPLHPGWDSVLRTRSVVARCSIPRVAASGAALLLRCAWLRTRCITPKTISASSFGVSRGSSANPKPSP